MYPDSAVFLFLLIADLRDCDVREAGTHLPLYIYLTPGLRFQGHRS